MREGDARLAADAESGDDIVGVMEDWDERCIFELGWYEVEQWFIGVESGLLMGVILITGVIAVYE